ncbi:MAG TPA: TonB-dependent receptor, partial [Bacteroidales bacterium]|nr:TonB-dependent receptor [Bacteroidales bacterium]
MITFSYSGFAQSITIINEVSREPVGNVALFNKSRDLATLSGPDGKANISIFKDNDSIFFQHPSFNPAVFLKRDLHDGQQLFLSKRVILIDEFVISATKSRENKKNIPYMVDALDATGISESLSQSSADLLLATGNIAVQKSQGGGGSPIIRGFEANKILLVIDGVRMNNAIYRSGHLQNAITIDNAILDRVEVIFGPTSLIYGSDALGGVIHYYTKDPVLAGDTGRYTFRATAYTSYATANTAKTGHLDFTNGFKNLGFLSSITYKDLGDIRMGRNKNPFYGDYGELLHYAARRNGRDTTLANPDPFLQLNTGYKQLDLLQKVKYTPSQYFDLILNLQYSTSSNIGRYDELKNYSGDRMKYAEYYYGPQNRFFGSLKSVVKKHNFMFTNATTTLAYQRIDEDRITRKFGVDDKRYQLEDVDVYSLNVDMLKLLRDDDRLNYGVEVTYNNVTSTARYRNIITGLQLPAETRYPDGGSYAATSGLYLNYKFVPNANYILSAGARYHYGLYHSEFIPGGILPYNNISINNGALTGSLSMVYHPGKKWQINAIASSGFRNPNIDDYGKIRAKDGMVTVPNPDLKPEYSYNLELG